MSDPAPPPSPDYVTPTLRWLAALARRAAHAVIGQPGLNIVLAAAAAVGVAGGYPHVKTYIHLPPIVWPIPTPTPPPTPPPTPTPSVAGLSRVIIVYESSWPLTRGQVDTILSNTVRNYLDGALPKDAAGRSAWRVWDKDTDKANEPAEWQNAYAQAAVACAGKIPQVVTFDTLGRATAFSLPETPEDLVARLQKLKGN